ncbi:hypothetical protein EDC04DRAFT_2597790 [Pisolithus marmoratus]|nr:hypothetical protein EDC04DRAFT_2597790 [Pisolithus marmoratus]
MPDGVAIYDMRQNGSTHGWTGQTIHGGCYVSWLAYPGYKEVFFGPWVLPDISIPVPLLLQANHMLRTIVQAYQNPFVVHETQCGKTRDTAASLQYKEIMATSVVLDENGNIKLWYLPGTIDYTHQKNIWNSLHGMGAALEDSLKPSCQHGWLKPGEEVKVHPKVSRLLKSGRKPNGMQQWVDQMSDIHALLSGTLAVIHPWMFAAGREALIRLGMEARTQEDTDMSSILWIWNSLYNCASIMVNCTTPYHTDINGWEPWLDMLMMVGDYTPLDMVIPTLKLQFRYNPGTIITMYVWISIGAWGGL